MSKKKNKTVDDNIENVDAEKVDAEKVDAEKVETQAEQVNVADTLNEIFDDDPAKKAREREIAKYEKKRQKALEREAKKAAKAELKKKKMQADDDQESEKAAESKDDASDSKKWSWDKAVQDSSAAENDSAAPDNGADSSSADVPDDGEVDEQALKKQLKAEKKAARKLKKEQKKEEEKEVNIVKDLLFLCLYILIVIGICWAVLTYVGQRTEVSGESMSNTLHSGDTLWIDKLEYETGSPKRFDIVVFPYGDDDETFYIKRVIGMPGETVYIGEDGTIYINDEPLEGDKYGREVIAEDKRGVASEVVTLGEDEYFVLGDNRNNSRDSRVAEVGNIHKNDIVGKAVFRFTGGFGKIH